MIHGWERLCDELDELGGSIGFRREELLETKGMAPLPEGAATWRNSFATLLLVPAASSRDDALYEARDIATAWMRDRLEMEEHQGNLVDGYVLLVLPEPLTAGSSAVAEIEQDPYTCRKHVLWPLDDGSWRTRLLGVTTLGLPDAPATFPLYIAVQLPSQAERVLELWEMHGGSARNVAKAIHDAAAQAAEEEVAAHAG